VRREKIARKRKKGELQEKGRSSLGESSRGKLD